ncbi:hypothetical protein [Magnetospirillum sp. ME-1]|nr:hypothetical protein [Magnetospirillum sp. ME-1]
MKKQLKRAIIVEDSVQMRSLIHPGFPRWRCDYVTAAAKSDIEIKAVRTI